MNRRQILTGGAAAGAAMMTMGRAEAGMQTIKCVIVGPEAAGKTSAAISFTTNAFPDEYIPTVFDNYQANIMHRRRPYNFTLWDTPGSSAYDRLRPLSYESADVVVLAYDTLHRASFEEVPARWLPEIRHHLPTTPILLSGFKTDRRNDPMLADRYPVQTQEGAALAAAEGLNAFRECSARTQEGLRDLFLASIDLAVGEDPDQNPEMMRMERQIDPRALRRAVTRPMTRPGGG